MVAIFETVMTFGTILIVGAGIAAYASMSKLKAGDRLTMVRGRWLTPHNGPATTIVKPLITARKEITSLQLAR